MGREPRLGIFRSRWPVSLWLDVAFLLLGGALMLSFYRAISGDGSERYNAILAVAAGRLSHVRYSVIGPLFALPLWLVGQVMGSPLKWVALYNPVVFLIGLAVLARVMSPILPPRVLRRFMVLLLFASMFPMHVQNFYGEVFTSVMVATGIAALCIHRSAIGWVGVVVGLVNTPATMLAGTLVSARQAWRERRWRLFLVPVAAMALYVLDTWVREGTPMISGYAGDAGATTVLPYSGRPDFSYPPFFGLLSILLSFGKGVLFFAPGLWFCAGRWLKELPAPVREMHVLWLWFLCGTMMVYSHWWAWYVGWFLGPRFLLFAAFPASLTLAFMVEEAKTVPTCVGTLLALALSFLVGVDGALFSQTQLSVCTDNSFRLELLCRYTPEFSALWHPFVASLALSMHDTLFLLMWFLAFCYLAAQPSLRLIWLLAAAFREWRQHPVARWRF